jgi:hypothetical protein
MAIFSLPHDALGQKQLGYIETRDQKQNPPAPNNNHSMDRRLCGRKSFLSGSTSARQLKAGHCLSTAWKQRPNTPGCWVNRSSLDEISCLKKNCQAKNA